MSRLTTLVAPLLLFGCAGGPSIDRDVEDRLTIAQGVYGQTTSLDDVGEDNEPEYHSMSLEVFASPRPANDEAVVRVTSGERGFYEAALTVGSFEICTSFGRCRAFEVAQGARVRLDYEFSVGPGWSEGRLP